MANKAFEIQNSTLKIGGVELQAGTTGVVIPGVTQATNYRAEEVEDGGGDDTNVWQDIPVVIDQETYNRLAGIINLSDGWVAPTYEVEELDDDGKIDGIQVIDGGTIPNETVVAHMTDNMFAAPAGSSIDPQTFDANIWVAIPYYVKCRAGEVETIGGGGGGSGLVERTVQFPYGEDGDTAGTMALDPSGNVYVCTADWTDAQQNYEVDTSEDYLSSQHMNNGIIFHIPRSQYSEVAALFDSSVAGDWTIDGELDGGDYTGPWTVIEIGSWTFTSGDYQGETGLAFTIASLGPILSVPDGTTITLNYTGNRPSIWTQANTGSLYIDGNIIGSTNSAAYINMDANNGINQLALGTNDGAKVIISTDGGGTELQFTAENGDASIIFPDGSIQTTAYTGTGGVVTVTTDLWVAAGSSPGGAAVLSSTDGVNWTTNDFMLANTSINRVAINDSVIVYLVNGDTTDGIYYASAPEDIPVLATGTNMYGEGFPVRWDEINYLGGKFVAVGCYTTTTTISTNLLGIALPDGVTRTTTSIGVNNTSFDFDYVNVTISGATNTELNGNFRLVYNQLDTIATGVYDLINTDGSPVVLTSTDVTGATLVTTQPEGIDWPIYTYSTDGVTWTYGEIDPDYYMAILGTTPRARMADVAYNGTGYLIPIVNNHFRNLQDDPTNVGPGAFYITDLAVGANAGNFVAGAPGGLPGTFNNIASYADGTFFVSDDQYTVWTATDPLDTWTPHDITTSLTNLFGYTADINSDVNGDVDSAVAGTVNGQQMWVGTTNAGAVIYTTDNGGMFLGSIVEPYTATATLVTSTSSSTLIEFTGENPYPWEKITLTVAQGDDTNWNGTYWAISANDPQNPNQYYLCDGIDGNGIPSDGFTAPSNPFNITLSHGQDLDAIHVADNVCIVHSGQSNTLYRSADLVTWTKVYVGNGDYSVDDIYYGTRSTLGTNRLDYTDEETGYNSSAILTYNFKVDVDNAHLDVNGDGSWELGSTNKNIKIGAIDLVADEKLDFNVKTPNAEWTFDRNGKLHFPDGTRQTTAYVHRNINLDGGGAAVHYEQEVGFADGGFSATRHGVADPAFDGGNRLTESNQYNINGGGA